MEVEFEQREYSPVENDGTVTVCANLVGQTDKNVSVLFSTTISPEGVLGEKWIMICSSVEYLVDMFMCGSPKCMHSD